MRWQELKQKLDTIYKLTQKKIVWIYEASNLTSIPEIQTINSSTSITHIEWYLEKDEKPNDGGDILIFVYAKSADSQLRIQKIVNYAKSHNKEVPLIIYTRYASADQRLSGEEFETIQQHSKPIIANMPETLMQGLKKLLN